MLEKIGGECAGAITFVMPNEQPIEANSQPHPIDEKEFAELLRQLPKKPLLAGEKGVRLSLAGVQDKIAVQLLENQIVIPTNGAPSTHIIKPALPDYPNIIANEAFCMKLASLTGLNAAKGEHRKSRGHRISFS